MEQKNTINQVNFVKKRAIYFYFRDIKEIENLQS